MLSLCILLSGASICLSQVPGRYAFYQGDTLKGFDFNACYKQTVIYSAQHGLTEYEKYLHIRGQEDLFVDQKYHRVTPKDSKLKVTPVITSACNNLDFELGNYTGWTGAWGYNNNSGLPLSVLGPVIWTHGTNYPETGCAYHTLVTAAAGNDPYSALPMLDPGGGTTALRLGGEWINLNGPQTYLGVPDSCTSGKQVGALYNSAGEMVQQTFLVSAANAMLTYNYATVIDQAQHAPGECPYFRAEVLDNAGNPIPCMQYYVQSDSTNTPPGMSVSSVLNGWGGPVFVHTAWQTNSFNLKTYIGQNVTVRFTAAGCTHGGHFGYAYVDATCGPIQVLASSPEVCLGGTINLTAPGASASGTYSWTGPGIVGSSTAQTVTLNAAGTYDVTVTQAPGCFYTIDTTIAFFPVPVLTLASTNASCSPGNDGTATATVTGGNTPYTYSWSPNPGAGGTTANATAMAAGTYTCTVTTANGCTASGTVIITQPPGAPTVTVSSTPASCSPGGDGTCTATVTGGATPYTYSWTGGAIGGGQGTAGITGLNAGTYTITVTTPSGTCSATATATVTSPGGPSSTSVATPVACFGGNDGTATATPTGGAAPFTYSWTTANGTIGGGGTTTSATGLTAGTYTFSVTDGTGCSATNTVTVVQPTVLAVTASGVGATCNGKCNGQVICIPTGGTATYTYSWSGSGCTTASCNNICAGTYTSTITDAHGCTATSSAVVPQPTPLVMTVGSKAADCGKPDGKDSVNVTGGTPGYTYSWSPATGAGATTTNYSLLVPGSYTIYIKDNNGCPDSMINVVPNKPGVVLSPLASTRDTCFGSNNGTATVAAAGGFPAYTYSWTGGAITGGQGTVSATGLSAGTYTCTVTDSAHCVSTVVMPISQPPPVTLSPGPPPTICIGACTTLTAVGAGGTPGYTYVWAQGATVLASTTVCPLVTTTYTATIVDSHGCVAPPVNITVIVNPPLEVVASGANTICPGSSTVLGAVGSGGNGGPYTYNWMPPTGLSSTTVANPTASPTVTTTYTVIVNDNCGTPTDSDYVTVTLYPLPIVNFTSVDTVKCAPVCATFTGTSNPACASATWTFGDGATGSGCNTVVHCYNTAGNYPVTYNVIDIHGCKGSQTINNFINALPVPDPNFSASPQPTTILDPQIFFTDLTTGSVVSWSWNFGDFTGSTSILQNPNYTYPDTGCYPVTLSVVGSDGCPAQVEHPVCIQPYFTFYAPNTFTPNGDGKNDTWSPNGIGIDPNNYHLMMFDRWGNLMWETYTWLEGWNGKANNGANIAQIDTYVWKVDLKDVFHEKHQYIGHCNIIK